MEAVRVLRRVHPRAGRGHPERLLRDQEILEMSSSGASLARIERRAIWIAIGMAALALVLPPAGPPVAAGVFGGAFIAAISYWAIKRGVDGLAIAMAEGANARARAARALIMLVGRYALLAL